MRSCPYTRTCRLHAPTHECRNWCNGLRSVAVCGCRAAGRYSPGVSGVGKSSLINRLATSCRALPTGAVGAKGEGRHITTRSETIGLDDETHPSWIRRDLRKLSSWSIEPEDLPHLFPEIRPLIGQCRFRDCAHIDEPSLRRALCPAVTGAI